MFRIGPLRSILALAVCLAACSPRSPFSAPQPLPSPGASWSVQLNQSGGFIGVKLNVQVSSDGRLTAEDQRAGRTVTQQLPPEALARLLRLYSSIIPPPSGPQQSACADCFLYDLQLNSEGQTIQIHADDTTLASSGAADLIAYLQQLRDSALRSKP